MTISPQEVTYLRSIKNTAIILLVMFRLDHPTGETEISEILDMHPQTVRYHLRSMARLGLITRTHHKNGYLLTGSGSQLILGATAKTSRLPITTTINLNSREEINRRSNTGATAKTSRLGDQNESYPQSYPQVWEALEEAGITRNPRTEALAALEHITPEYVRAHYEKLKKQDKGGQTGLLITILESGAPAPKLESSARQDPYICEKCSTWPCSCDETT